MKFTTHCFVRVEDAEQRDELRNWCYNIGYYPILIPAEQRLGQLVICDEYGAGVCHAHEDFSDGDYIDCGVNVELFKALAAMNNENDCEQWFTDGEEWILSEYSDFDGCMTTAEECAAGNVGSVTFCQEYGFHKASADEIIKHLSC